MIVVDAEQISALLSPKLLLDALRESFRQPIEVPVRHHHSISRPGGEVATLLLMPAWTTAGADNGQYLGIKIATVFPENAKRNAPSVEASYLLMAGDTGTPLAVMNGRAVTLWRTAAASALAAYYLAAPKAERLLLVGAGALAPYLARAHAANRPITHIEIWNRDTAKAEHLARDLAGEFGNAIRVSAAKDLAVAVSAADIVSAATLSTEPLIKGAWLKAGAHVDLVGGFTPKMREADDEAVRRARIFVDTRGGALREAGDIVQPVANGVIRDADIEADLFDLCRGTHGGRTSDAEITLFKSVGTAIEDLAAAVLVYERLKSRP